MDGSNNNLIQPADRISIVEEYYFSKKLKQIAQMRTEGKDVLNLGIGNPDNPPSEATIDALVEQSRKEHTHGYQSYIGIPELRNAYANWYETYFNITFDPRSEILPLIGSKEGIMHISMAFVNQGDGVLVPDPGYPTYSAVSKLVGANIITYNLKEDKNWMPDFAELEKQDLSKVKLMWVNYPNMPTGAPASPELFQKLVDFGIKHQILIVNDNPYSFIQNDSQISIFSAPKADNIALELNSLSKSHNMAGWRMGMVAGNSAYIENILRVKSNMDSGMFLPMQKAAAQALMNSKSWYEKINAEYSARKKKAYEILEAIGCSIDPSQVGMFVWAKIPDNYPSVEELSEKILQEANVFITPGFIFGKNGERYLRISLCTKEEILEQARSRISKFF